MSNTTEPKMKHTYHVGREEIIMSNTAESKQTHALHVVMIALIVPLALVLGAVYLIGRAIGAW